MATLAGFRTRFPEFDSLADAFVEAKLDDASARVNASVWGSLTDLGIYYLAGHDIALSPSYKGGSAAGPVQSETAGSLSRAYAVGGLGASAGTYGLTTYGMRYVGLLKQVQTTPRLI